MPRYDENGNVIAAAKQSVVPGQRVRVVNGQIVETLPAPSPAPVAAPAAPPAPAPIASGSVNAGPAPSPSLASQVRAKVGGIDPRAKSDTLLAQTFGGIGQAARGVESALSLPGPRFGKNGLRFAPDVPEKAMAAFSDVVEGMGRAGVIALPAFVAAAPAVTALTLAAGAAAGKGAEMAARSVGLSPEAQRAAANAAMLVATTAGVAEGFLRGKATKAGTIGVEVGRGYAERAKARSAPEAEAPVIDVPPVVESVAPQRALPTDELPGGPPPDPLSVPRATSESVGAVPEETLPAPVPDETVAPQEPVGQADFAVSAAPKVAPRGIVEAPAAAVEPEPVAPVAPPAKLSKREAAKAAFEARKAERKAEVVPATVEANTGKPVSTPETAAEKVDVQVKRVVDTKGVKSAAEVHRRVLAALEAELEPSITSAGFSEISTSNHGWGGREGAVVLDGKPIAKFDKHGRIEWYEDTDTNGVAWPTLDRAQDGATPSEMQKQVMGIVSKAVARHRGSGTITLDIPGDGTFTIENNPHAIATVMARIKSGGTAPWKGLDETSVAAQAERDAAKIVRPWEPMEAPEAAQPKKSKHKPKKQASVWRPVGRSLADLASLRSELTA